MMKKRDHRSGYTLIETVVVLLLAGILAGSFVMAVVPATEAMVLLRGHSATLQKTQYFFGRISRELAAATRVVRGTADRIEYEIAEADGATVSRVLTWDGEQVVLLDGVPLHDDVAIFSLRYYADADTAVESVWAEGDRLVEIALQSRTGSGIVYTNRVFLRGLR